MVLGPFLFKMQVLIRNEMGQKQLLTEELFLEILRVAESHGWNPVGTAELYSTQPSIRDYLPRGIDGRRTVSKKDALGIHGALKIAMAGGVSIFGIRSSLENEVEDEKAAFEDLMEYLVEFFHRGWVVVCRWRA